MTTTDRVRAYLRVCPATRYELAEALGLTPAQITYAIQGMQSRAETTTVGKAPYVKGPALAIYALAEMIPTVTPQSIVAIALANEPELARVWK